MEYKSVTLGVLIMSMMMLADIHVEAKFCCATKVAKQKLEHCLRQMRPQSECAKFYGCKAARDSKCPPGYPNDVLKNSGDIVNEYCKLGCTSFVCGALTTLHTSDASEIVNGAVEQCTTACSSICTKGSKTALEIA